MQLPKLSTANYILIGSLAIAIICIFVFFKGCEKIPKDDSTAKIDSIQKAQTIREDSLRQIIAMQDDAITVATNNADSFYLESERQRTRANIAGKNFQGMKQKYEALKSIHDSTAFDAADEAIAAAQEEIFKLDSTIKLKDLSIAGYKQANGDLKKQIAATQISREGFRQDFMKLKTDVVVPLQAQLKEANKQWAANRFWKKTFAGVAATAIIYGAIQTFKK